MHWNHRVCKETDEHDNVFYSIREVYYNDKDEVTSVTSNIEGIRMFVYDDPDDDSTPLESLEQTVKWMRKALSKPVLDIDTLEYAED